MHYVCYNAAVTTEAILGAVMEKIDDMQQLRIFEGIRCDGCPRRGKLETRRGKRLGELGIPVSIRHCLPVLTEM